MTTNRQYFDPEHLVREVRELLHAHGLDTEIPGDAQLTRTGASMLLRGLGIMPGMDGVDALARAMDKPWVDTDDLLAEFRSAETDRRPAEGETRCGVCGHEAGLHAGRSGHPCDVVFGDSDIDCACTGFVAAEPIR
ncbi:hypothetical protein ABZ897_59990 [Nonomuraea sp. NPDC046802]|uniref:hypothetical protein n=1 Tax=Nonomuraea sp. NPDC046802 TaxID=3154919 RepID=UPI0033CE4102